VAGTSRRRGIVAEINVTPLVDIMLVLLIIFMLTAHLIARQAIEVELPRAAQSTSTPPTTLAVTVTKDGTLYLNAEPVTPEALRAAVRDALAKDPKTQAVTRIPLYEANERIATISRDAAVLARRQVAIDTVQTVVAAYWDLVLAERRHRYAVHAASSSKICSR